MSDGGAADDRADDAGLFEAAPCGYAVVDAGGTVLAANAELHRIVGAVPGSMPGRALASVLSVGGRIYFETHLWPVLEHDAEVREVSIDLVRTDGARVPVLLNASRSEDGRTVRAVFMETRDRYRYEQDLLVATRLAERSRAEATALAQMLQQTLIPPAPPAIPRLAISATYRPAGDGSTVGGDFYDVFQLGPANWLVTLGDVSGKGVSAAAITSMVRYTIRALAMQHPDPSVLLRELDRALHRHQTEHYCTLVIAQLTEFDGEWTVRLSLGGHPPPLLVGEGGSVRELGSYGSAVGLIAEPEFHTVEHRLGDDTLVLYTDGVTEARSPAGLYGDERLVALVASTPRDPDSMTHAIAEAVLEFQSARASDDIAVVALRAWRDPTPQPSDP